MKLLTKEILSRFEKQGYTGDTKPADIKIILKLFNPVGVGTWYLYEYNPEDRIAMGFCNLGNPTFAECGSVSLDELEALRLPMGLSIERDMHFGFDHTLQEVIDAVTSGKHM